VNDLPLFPDRTVGQTIAVGLRCKCPRCGLGKTFSGYLKVAERCVVCDLDLSGHDTGDGAVVPAMLLLGSLVVGMAAYVEFSYAPPLWVHIILWIPVIFGLTMLILQPLKGISVALQYKYRSVENTVLPHDW